MSEKKWCGALRRLDADHDGLWQAYPGTKMSSKLPSLELAEGVYSVVAESHVARRLAVPAECVVLGG